MRGTYRKCHGNSWSAKRVVRATGSLGVAEDRKSEWSGLDAGSVKVPKISGRCMLTPTSVVVGTVISATMGTMESARHRQEFSKEDQLDYGYRRLNPP